MLYRMRIYQAVRENLPVFHDFFRAFLLPVQLRHGARLVGRWETEDHRVVAIWEYDDRAAYERIEAAVRDDPDSQHAQNYRGGLPALMTVAEEVFMSSTVSLTTHRETVEESPQNRSRNLPSCR
jgi:NIPSNAP